MPEIIIQDPLINTDPLKDHAYRAMGRYEIKQLMGVWDRCGISPEICPVVADVCAGDGGWARILTDNGWRPENITCIDRKRTETPLVAGVNWEYWDVEELGTEILLGRPLPDAVKLYENRFDLVLLVNGGISRHCSDAVGRFLVCPGGKVFN